MEKQSNNFSDTERPEPINIFSDAEKKANNHSPLKQNAKAIAIILFIVTYILLFTTVFTNEQDTYICYTTATGECYHAEYCHYLRQSSYQTTVYEAKDRYRPCSKCDPCIERYKITITERNYVTPLFISGSISVAIFFVLKSRD